MFNRFFLLLLIIIIIIRKIQNACKKTRIKFLPKVGFFLFTKNGCVKKSIKYAVKIEHKDLQSSES